MVIQENLQNTLWIPYVLRNPDQLDDIFLPMLVKLQQLREKGLAPRGWGGVQLRALEKLPEALGDLPPCPPRAPLPRMSVPPRLPHAVPKCCGSVVRALVGFSFFSFHLAKEAVKTRWESWGSRDTD